MKVFFCYFLTSLLLKNIKSIVCNSNGIITSPSKNNFNNFDFIYFILKQKGVYDFFVISFSPDSISFGVSKTFSDFSLMNSSLAFSSVIFFMRYASFPCHQCSTLLLELEVDVSFPPRNLSFEKLLIIYFLLQEVGLF